MTYESWRQAWLITWGMIGLACLQAQPVKKTRKKRQRLPPAKIKSPEFLDIVIKESGKVFGTLSRTYWAVLTQKLKKLQLDQKDAYEIARYLKRQGWLTNKLHVTNFVNKLEVWQQRTELERKNAPQEEENIFKNLRR